ncbi:hypothetical protein [Pseudomonas sp.]|uniref:hypothetical protein n=1 Tax=Pseudomonas sp. TaxID=306 RepID=UPI0026134415|nr:hypothetical protein [Pseudomonas sp.]
MDKIIECVERNGERWVGIVELTEGSERLRKINHLKDSQQLGELYIKSHLKWPEFKETLGCSPITSESWFTASYRIPLKPVQDVHCMVSGFGYTHRLVNGTAAAEHASPDWYYKGNGKGLITQLQSIKSPYHASGAGIEIEYACVYVIDAGASPHYMGYTLAVDFSDPVLRHSHPSLAGLSKLRNTAVSHELVMAEPPPYSIVQGSVVRQGKVVWEKHSRLGLDQLLFAKTELEELLFRHDELCEPGMVHYVLLGASLSTDRDGFELQHGDIIQALSERDGLLVSNRFEDDAVRLSCNC